MSGEPGGTVRVETGSSAKDIFIVRHGATAWRRYRVGSIGLQQPVTGVSIHGRSRTADRGGFGIADAFVKDNRLYVHRTLVEVPWDNKKLQIRYTSFRDKTEPGSEEKWAVSISGWRGSRVAAQVLTAMYDASLDQFERPFLVRAAYLYPSMGECISWQMIDDFRASRSISLGEPVRGYPRQIKRYDQLMRSGG